MIEQKMCIRDRYVVEKVVIENSGEKYYFIEMFVNENPCVKQVRDVYKRQ